MKKLQIVPFLFLFICSVCIAAPSNTMSITPAAVDASTIEATDENTRNNEVSTKYNAHTHSDLTSSTSVTHLYGSGTGSGTNMTLKFGNSTNVPAIRWNGTLDAFQYSEDQSTWITLPMTQGSSGDVLVSKGSGVIPRYEQIDTAGRRFQVGASQTISTGTSTLVTLDAETFDKNDEFIANKYTVKIAGLYLCIGAVRYTSPVADTVYEAHIYKGGSGQAVKGFHASSTTAIDVVVVDVLELAVTNYIELYTQHNAGGDETITNSTPYTYLNVIRIR